MRIYRTTRRRLAGALAVLLAAGPSWAVTAPRHESTLKDRVVAPASLVATVVPEPLAKVEAELPPATRTDLARFRATAGSGWEIYVDRRSGGMALVEGRGIPWTGIASAADGAAKARAFVAEFPNLFQVAGSDLVLDEAASTAFGEGDAYRSVVFRQRIDGVEVEGARVIFRIAHGNLVQFGVDRIAPKTVTAGRSAAASLSFEGARSRLASHVGGLKGDDRVSGSAQPHWILEGAGDDTPYAGPIGQGWTPRLVYEVELERVGELGAWKARVDAERGDMLRFVDGNDYVSLVKGSVYTLTNCTDAINCVPGTATETRITMPFAAMNFVGGSCTGDACYSNSAGAFEYPPGAVAASTSLDGKYFRITDSCGPVSSAAAAPADLDLGTSDPNPPLNTNTDCQPATRTSPPETGVTSGGAGDTHAARNTFYHLNLIAQKARAYLPDNEWLKGVDGNGVIPVVANGPPACNAFWQGNAGGLFFLKNTPPPLSCNNTGEIPDVFLHEFGHGLDQNDGTGRAPESATGEAMGDTFALLQGQHSCLGPGLFLPIPTNVNWGNRAGYGTGSALCTGVRDLDYTRFCYHGTAAGCTASQDPDAPNGSRSGPTPPPNPPDAGTPARWNHMISGSPTSLADGQSNFYNCGGPETGGCAGPLSHGCHCESLIPSQANWDLAKGIIASRFGGNAYTSPQGPTEVSGWQYMDRLWYLTRDLATSAYSATGPAPAGTTNGCGIGNWFSTYRFVDDDNGNLADGTPHAHLIFAAFDRHAIACGSAADASNQGGGCGAPVAAATLSACGDEAPVQLSWTPSAGATEFRVLRNTLGCGFGFTPIATTGGGRTFYEDEDVAPGVPYYYTVQPVGESDSCYGFASNCVAVTPQACGATAASPPATVNLSTPAGNQVLVTWTASAGAGAYKVSRRIGTCASGGAFVPIANVTAPTTSFLDADSVNGGVQYAYRVATSSDSCSSCVSTASTCQTVTATGTCDQSPAFDGIETVVAATDGACALIPTWTAGSSLCGGALHYDVFRSTDPRFVPGPGNLITTGVTGTTYTDRDVLAGVRYYYAVRAVDGVGNADANVKRVGETGAGSLVPGTYIDSAGDAPPAKLTASPTADNTWAVRPADTANPSLHYATTATGNYPHASCMGLETNTVALGASPTLSFRTTYDMEPGWDGGYVEVSTESGGYSDWTKLDSITYPGVMGGPLGSPACGGEGFADGAPVFTGTLPVWQTFSGSLSAYANQRVRVRFLFSSDESTNGGGWQIDDVSVTNALVPVGACLQEVSAPGGPALRLAKRPDGDLDLIFQDLGATASSYNVYAGAIGSWYSHQSDVCHDTSSVPGAPGAGQRTLFAYSPPAGGAYFLVSASNSQAEGVLGFDGEGKAIPPPAASCGPTP
jgi:trimeric autotransporter adhesin